MVEMLVEKWPRTYQKILTHQLNAFCARYADATANSSAAAGPSSPGGGAVSKRASASYLGRFGRSSTMFVPDDDTPSASPSVDFSSPTGRGKGARASIQDNLSLGRSPGSPGRNRRCSSNVMGAASSVAPEYEPERATALSACFHLAVHHRYAPFFAVLKFLPQDFLKHIRALAPPLPIMLLCFIFFF